MNTYLLVGYNKRKKGHGLSCAGRHLQDAMALCIGMRTLRPPRPGRVRDVRLRPVSASSHTYRHIVLDGGASKLKPTPGGMEGQPTRVNSVIREDYLQEAKVEVSAENCRYA